MSKHNGEAFTKPDDEAPVTTTFNLRRWIDGEHIRVVKRVEVILAPGLEAIIEDLDARLVRERGKGTPNAELRDLAEEVEAKRALMEESRTTFKFRAMDAGEIDQIKAEHPDIDPEELGLRIFAAQCLTPKVTWEDLRDLNAALGQGYFTNTILRAAVAASEGGGVSVPFSLNASAILTSLGSSES